MIVDTVANTLAAHSTYLWESVISVYGYLAIAVGVFLEGETVVMLSGYTVHQHYLVLSGVVLAAIAGAVAGDWLFFYLGRAERHLVLDKHPDWKGRIDAINALLSKHQNTLIVFRRFFYGLRNLTAFVVGMSPISVKKFLWLNLISAMLWAGVYGLLGYFLWDVLGRYVPDLKKYEGMLVLGFLALAFTVGMSQLFRLRKKIRLREKNGND